MISEDLYDAYPRHIGVRVAIEAIGKALKRLNTTEKKYLDGVEPALFLARKIREFAESPAGQREQLTPHPSTWFNQSRYLDDPAEWWARDREQMEQARLRASQGMQR